MSRSKQIFRGASGSRALGSGTFAGRGAEQEVMSRRARTAARSFMGFVMVSTPI